MVHFERKPGATILVAPLVRLRFGARLSSQTALMHGASSRKPVPTLKFLSNINREISNIPKSEAY
jgi:hypothetical protein